MNIDLPPIREVVPNADLSTRGTRKDLTINTASNPVPTWDEMSPTIEKTFSSALDDFSRGPLTRSSVPAEGFFPQPENNEATYGSMSAPAPASLLDNPSGPQGPQDFNLSTERMEDPRASSFPASVTMPMTMENWGPGSSNERFPITALPPFPSGNDLFQSRQQDLPFSQVALGDPLVQLEPGQIFDSSAARPSNEARPPVDNGRDPITLGALDLESLTSNQILFTFGVICIMARLTPRFQFKYGGLGGNKVGVRLTVYGHTVVIQPESYCAHLSRVAACKKALFKLRKFHPQWLTPPLPSDRPTGPEWNWARLLEEFCTPLNFPMPLYNPTLCAGQWHCDLSLQGRLFRTASASDSLDEAQNTVSHIAIYSLLVDDRIPSNIIEPASDPPIEIKKEKEKEIANIPSTMAEAVDNLRLSPTLPPRMVEVLKEAGLLRGGFGGGKRGGKRGKVGRGGAKNIAHQPPKPVKPAKPQNPPKHSKPQAQKPQIQNPANPPMSKKAAKAARRAAAEKEQESLNANYLPLTNSRVAPLLEKPKISVDPLATMKKIQQQLGQNKDASYRGVLTRICSILGIKDAEIRREDNANPGDPLVWVIVAYFDTSHPFLSRASPVALCKLPKMNEDDAISLGAKKATLFLLDMIREDAGIDAECVKYPKGLGGVKELEREFEFRYRDDLYKYGGVSA
ncbi:hypothetical protein N7540_010383 [Penicillium herquei]|nr:hypothetical protein N7540_010383 [Penicillium herquei]